MRGLLGIEPLGLMEAEERLAPQAALGHVDAEGELRSGALARGRLIAAAGGEEREQARGERHGQAATAWLGPLGGVDGGSRDGHVVIGARRPGRIEALV